MANSKRSLRIADLIQREVAKCLQAKINDPRLTRISIVEVDVSPDTKAAKVYYTMLDPEEVPHAQKALDKAAGFIRHFVAENSVLRYTPKLIFKYDDTQLRASNLSQLIREVAPEEEIEEEDDQDETS